MDSVQEARGEDRAASTAKSRQAQQNYELKRPRSSILRPARALEKAARAGGKARPEREGRQPAARQGHGGGDRQDHRALDRHPRGQTHGGRARKAAASRRHSAQAGRRPGRGRARGLRGHPPQPRRHPDPNRPIGSFLFLGPTGVGKTELAKTLAESLFDDEKNLVRIDMTEYMEKFSVSRLIGAPPGYVGYDEGGQLTEAVRRRPYSVVLFDEIEKAHPDVFNILLQVLDDGRITDSQGRTVDFKNTVIILTSNLGSQYLLDGIDDRGNISQEARQQVTELLHRTFRPEFLNRLDEIVFYKPLTKDNICKIIDLQIAALNGRLADKQLKCELTDEAKQFIIDAAYDPQYGARPLRRYVQHTVETLLARRIVAGSVLPGATLKVAVQNGELALV
jgi:energy-coupling factor transporter ATP-binding protein EcfA2